MTQEQVIESIHNNMQEMNRQIREIQLTLENETNRNIRIIAEGHMDLTRKLDEALKISNEKEMLLIRVNSLESEMVKLRKRVEAIA